MLNNGFTFIETLISLTLLSLVMVTCLASLEEYQVLHVQTHHLFEQYEELAQLHELILTQSYGTHTTACPVCNVLKGASVQHWRHALPNYLRAELTAASPRQLHIKLCLIPTTSCLVTDILV
jgi:prepilin-type N-terminal cleavage/methylation domain-containing protein